MRFVKRNVSAMLLVGILATSVVAQMCPLPHQKAEPSRKPVSSASCRPYTATVTRIYHPKERYVDLVELDVTTIEDGRKVITGRFEMPLYVLQSMLALPLLGGDPKIGDNFSVSFKR